MAKLGDENIIIIAIIAAAIVVILVVCIVLLVICRRQRTEDKCKSYLFIHLTLRRLLAKYFVSLYVLRLSILRYIGICLQRLLRKCSFESPSISLLNFIDLKRLKTRYCYIFLLTLHIAVELKRLRHDSL